MQSDYKNVQWLKRIIFPLPTSMEIFLNNFDADL